MWWEQATWWFGFSEEMLRPYLLEERSLLPLFAFILLDLFGLPSLWGESVFRRVLHHVSGGGYAPWRVMRAPFMVKFAGKPLAGVTDDNVVTDNANSSGVTGKSAASTKGWEPKTVRTLLEPHHIDRILKMIEDNGKAHKYFGPGGGLNTKSLFLSKLVAGQFSKRSTIYYNDFTDAGKAIVNEIGEEIKPAMARLMGLTGGGEDLHLGSSDFRAVLLRYEGEQAMFSFHYDMESWNCFRTLSLIKRSPDVPVAPFSYMNGHGVVKDIELNDIGDGVLFQGTRLYHGVKTPEQTGSLRWMFGFQYRIGPDIETKRKSFCNQMRGGKYSMSQIYLLLFWRTVPLLFLKTFLDGQIICLEQGTNKTCTVGDAMECDYLTRYFDLRVFSVPRYIQFFLSITSIVLFTFHEGTRRIPFLVEDGWNYLVSVLRGDATDSTAGTDRMSSAAGLVNPSHSSVGDSMPLHKAGGAVNSSSNTQEEVVSHSGIPVPTKLPTFQTESVPRTFIAWCGISIVLAHSCCNDLTLMLTFSAYLVVSECCFPASKIDTQYYDKCCSMDLLRKHLPNGFNPSYRVLSTKP